MFIPAGQTIASPNPQVTGVAKGSTQIIGTAPGYAYSPSFETHYIVWNAQTIARLFEIGPHRFTPGTKMPEQTITNAQDREALVRFLEKATR